MPLLVVSGFSVKRFSYALDASLSEEFHFHSSCLVVLVSLVSLTLLLF